MARVQNIMIFLALFFSFSAVPAAAQVALSTENLVRSLQGLENLPGDISSAQIRQLAVASLKDPARKNPGTREPLVEQLNKLPQFVIAIEFDLNSPYIRPKSWPVVGRIADALYHPTLLEYRFLIVGHTDARGDRKRNLELSQFRANSVREALLNPFGINPRRLEAVGLGEEQLLNRADPRADENRRVQLITIGKM
jgi:OmpA-OmpF porin, OOP family